MRKRNTPTEALVLQVLDTAAALERGLDTALSHSRGVTFREYRLLQTLSQASDKGLTRVALARSTSVTPSAVTRALKPLEKLGYVTTARNERDARQSLAALTKGGEELLRDVAGVLTDYFNDLGVQSEDQAQLEALLQVLTRLQRR